MNDIDFDELDKAVSNLMGGVGPTKDKDEAEPKQKTLSISATLEPGQAPTYNKLDEAARSIGDETLVTSTEASVVPTIDDASLASAIPSIGEPAVTTPKPLSSEPQAPAKKRDALVTPRNDTGRFMDVMHSSSDMRIGSKDTVKPPLVQSEEKEDTAETESLAAPTPEQPTEPEKSNDAPTEAISPFLSDAKVEKRPLGTPLAVSATPAPAISAPSEPQESAKNEKTPVPTEPIVEEAPEEIIAINSDAPKKQEETKDAQAMIDPTKIELQDDESRQLQAIESSEAMTLVASQPVAGVDNPSATPAASVAIDQVSGSTSAIYDTQEYHQPLGHPAKKKSGWGLVVVIIVIIVLAAALGAAAYFILGLGV